VTALRPCTILAAAVLFTTACGGSDDANAAAAQARPGNDSGGASRATADEGGTKSVRPSTGNGGGGGAADGSGQRPNASITLAKQDVAVVRRGNIEEGVSVTGDLRPIEVVEIRARLEGDLIGVYVREGEHVNAGQLLARFEDSEQSSLLSSAKADKLATGSELTTARWNLDQTNELFKAGAIAERDFKLAQQAVATAAAKLAAADARVRATSSVLSDTRAVATTTGVISKKAVENGEHISRGASLFTLVRTNVLELVAAVPSRFSSAVRVGQTVNFSADGHAFDGKVARVSPMVDPTTRSVTVYVQVPNPSEALKGGTFAAGRVVSRTISKVLVVPTTAVRLTGDGQQFVYRIAGNAVDIANVQLGVVDDRGGMAEVLGGLTDGDRIIVGNVGTLGRGMQVIIAGEEGPATGRPGRAGTQSRP
jgi:RND family efflux transporter MFP subunit